jgi:hypothetical protein
MMYAQFKTTGQVEPIIDQEGNTVGYYVGRKNQGRIRLSRMIVEMFDSDNTIMIDSLGSFWVKK